MNRAVTFLAVAAFAVAGCGPVMDRGPSLPAPTDPGLQPPPIYGVIGQRAELDLTSQQVQTLDSIAAAVTAENRPLLREIEAIRGPEGRRTPTGEERARADSLIAQVRANSRQAAEQVGETLTSAQRDRVCALRAEARRRQPARPPPRAQPRRTPMIRLAPIGWPWCEPEVEPAGGGAPAGP